MGEMIVFGVLLFAIIYLLASMKKKMHDREVMYNFYKKEKLDTMKYYMEDRENEEKKLRKK